MLYSEILQQPQIKFLDLSLNRDGVAELGQLAPISFRGEAPIGVVDLAWRADEALFPLVEDWPIPTQTADTFLVRVEGEALRFLSPLRYAAGSEIARTGPMNSERLVSAQAVQMQRGIVRDAVDYRDVPVLAYATPVAGTPWLMVAKIDRSEAYARVWVTAWITGLVGAGALLLIYGSGYLLWRQTLARLAGERRLGTLVEQGLTGYAEADLEGRLTRVNDRYCAIVQRSRSDLIGRLLSDFTPPEDWATNRAVFTRLLQGESTSGLIEKRYLREDGGMTYAQVAIALRRDDAGRAIGYLALVADLTQRVEAEIALARESESLSRIHEEQRAIYDAATVGIALARDRVIRRCNRTMETMFGYEPGELIGKDTRLLYSNPQIYVEFGQRFMAGLREYGFYREEIEMVRKDRSPLWVRVSTVPIDPSDLTKGLAGTFEDITAERAAIARFQELNAELERKVAERTAEVVSTNAALKAANVELNLLATTDALTGAWNRRRFEQAAEAEIGRAQRYEHPLALLLFDIDHFKAINDRHGHELGDEVLVALTDLVKRNVRADDLLARWGGEEFTLLLPHSDGDAAAHLAEKLRALVAAWHFPEVGRVTISIGVAQWRHPESLSAWLKRVDAALYAAKAAGRDRVCVAAEPSVPASIDAAATRASSAE
jgi:diguanylate cyclase (GGDEF)-like protein/PAS domain S-box-containing protein